LLVAQRSAEQNQRPERDQVAVEHPLQPGDVDVEFGTSTMPAR
jgi:hypothetical protein